VAWTVLEALRPLGEKAPHRYVSLLAAASELRTLDPETVRYIYDALQKLQDRLTETGRLWPLVEAIRAYSNLMRRRQWHIGGLWKEAVADMCELYSKVNGRDDTTASGNGILAQQPLYTIAKVYVLAAALGSDVLAPLVRRYCGLGDLEEEAEAVRSVLDWAAEHPEELKKIIENDKDFAEWVRVRDVTEDDKRVIEDLRVRLTYVLARYKLNHAPDAEKLEEAAKEFEKAAEMRKRLKHWGGYLIARSLALRACVLAARSWEELLERAEGFRKLWEEAKKHLKPTARYLATAALPLGEYLVYLAASGDKRGAEELLKKWRWLLDYDPRASVNTRLMLKLLGVGDGARLKEVVDVFESSIWREFQPALLMLAGRLQKDEALKRCEQLPKPEVCVNAVVAATGDQDAVKGLKSEIEWEVPEASLLLDRVDGKTLVEVRAPKYPSAQLAFTLLAAVEGRADAVRLHGLWGSAKSKEPLPRQLSHAVYENCGDLNSEGCRVALLKLYYYHY
jgi:tetratricopeptide (TPR) repeat protein